nr:MAG TPA: hypothetical protein [Caudoviricetes sp.]
MKIEIYINKQLCDLDSSNISMRFKRQFINPAELNTKDAQKSYSITFPATPRNNNIFSYKNVEEIGDKFKIYDNVEVYIGGVRVFKGQFRLSETSRDYYKGNLGIPAPITIKDIFGETTMSQAGKWVLPFEGTVDLSVYNNNGYDSEGNLKYDLGAIPPIMFPLVLYGLLPKSANNNTYTPKNVYDNTVKLALDDLPPSVNVIQMLQKIFENANYSLTGSALNDDRLKNLYVSYKNPNDYELQWGVGKIYVQGKWRTLNKSTGLRETKLKINGDGRKRGIVNFFDSNNNNLEVVTDKGNNITKEGNRIFFRVPVSGLYKIRFLATHIMKDEEGGDAFIKVKAGDLNGVHTEIKILKNFDNNLDSVGFDNIFYRNNINQNVGDSNAVFPRDKEVNFIDPLQNKDFISGFAYGRYNEDAYKNPRNNNHCNPMAIKGGYSWSIEDTENGTTDRAYSATQNSGYVYADGSEPNPSVMKVELNRNTGASRSGDTLAFGELYQVIWLEKGDRLDIVGVSFADGAGIPGFNPHVIYNYTVNYSLELEPFQHYINWLKMDNEGASTEPMNWNDEPTFTTDEIDLIKFLPSEVKVNDWIDNFCKAFNLRLENIGPNRFELNIKNTELINRTSKIIDLDKKASVQLRTNQPLGIPYLYDLGFTIDNNEEGYIQSMQIDETTGERILNTGITGGGQFFTGSYETNTIQQTSTFSYNWFKQIYDSNGNELVKVPIITEHDIWEFDYDYKEMMSKTYFDKAQRFWYKAGVKEFVLNNYDDVDIKADLALVKNDFSGSRRLILDYENKQDSIMRTYFLLLTNNRNYTLVDCYLSPEEYTMLPYSLIKFNGDLYHTAEIDGYDPLGKNKGTIKLIRRIV